MNVPFLDLAREAAGARTELEAAFARVIDRGWYVLGPELEAFEREFAADAGVPFAIGVGCGTDAIAIALQATGAVEPGRGDEVLTPALSAAFTAIGIHQAGAVPRFVDVDLRTLQMDAAAAEEVVGPRTRAVVPVHLYGSACDVDAIAALAGRRGLAVVEDACQAHGARLRGRLLGTFADAGCFSFYPTKNLGALGDGGMIVTRSEPLGLKARKLRHGGQSRTYHHELLGTNSRLDEIQAALLRVKLERLESRNATRRAIAARYDAAFRDLPLALPAIDAQCEPNRHLYPVRARGGEERRELRSFLSARGVESLVHYPVPVPCQPALERFVLPGQRFPAAERAAGEILSLPLYPELASHEIEHVIESVRAFFESRG